MTGADMAADQAPSIDGNEDIGLDETLPVTTERLQALLEADTAKVAVKVSFRCYDIPFVAHTIEEADGHKLKLSGYVGALPFTAESSEAREMVKTVLACDPSCTLTRLALTRRNLIEIQGELPLDGQPSPLSILAAATIVVSSAKALIELMTDCLPLSCRARPAANTIPGALA